MTESDTGVVHVVRAVGAGGLFWGVFLLLRGTEVWSALEDGEPAAGEKVAVRVLGARHLLQGVAQVVAPRALTRVWVFVDLAHAASMIPVAGWQPGRRRAALLSAGVALAGGLAVLVAPRLGRDGST